MVQDRRCHRGEAARPDDSSMSAIRLWAPTTRLPYSPFEFDKLTSRLALQMQFTDNFMGYASYSEGFNSGGVSAATIGLDAHVVPV